MFLFFIKMPSNLLLRLENHPQRAGLALLFIFALLTFVSLPRLSLTYDEPSHYTYGLKVLQGSAARTQGSWNSKMPVSAWNALPAWLADRLPEGSARQWLSEITTGRYLTLVAALLVGALLFHWTSQLYGALPALLALLLFTWDPNVLAHSQLVTTDVYAMGGVLLSCYALWRFNRQRSLSRAAWLGLALGLALLAKYTSLFLLPVFTLLLLLNDAPQLWSMLRSRRLPALGRCSGQMAAYTGVALLVMLALVNLGFRFERTFTPLRAYSFQSTEFKMLQSRLGRLADLPLPLPEPFVQGLDLVRYHERTGKTYSRIYLMGNLSEDGFPGYYLVAYALKTPIAAQVLLWLGLATLLRRQKWQKFAANELFLLLPVIFFTVYFNLFYRAQIGLRYLLVIYPLLHILSARAIRDWKRISSRKGWALAGLLIYLLASVLSYYPHFIPYFNEFVPDRRYAYRYLADSNLDWGQSAAFVRSYLEQHPGSVVDPDRPASGHVLVSPNNLVGITAKPQTYRWLRENFQPSGTIAYTYLIYDIDPADLKAILPEP